MNSLPTVQFINDFNQNDDHKIVFAHRLTKNRLSNLRLIFIDSSGLVILDKLLLSKLRTEIA